MGTDLGSLVEIAARLAILRRLYVPETAAEARLRVAGTPIARADPPAPEAVVRRLHELRALMALTDYLHGRRYAGQE